MSLKGTKILTFQINKKHHWLLGAIFLTQSAKTTTLKEVSSEWAAVLAEDAPEWPYCDSFLLNRVLQKFLLAQNDSILHLFLEVWAYGVTSDVLDPQPQLLFFLRVILLGNLGGWRGQRSWVTKENGKLHAFIHVWGPLLRHDLGKVPFISEFLPQTKMTNQSGKTETDLWIILCFVYQVSQPLINFNALCFFFTYLKTHEHIGISCLALV